MITTHARVTRLAVAAGSTVLALAAVASPSAAMRHLKLLKSFPSADTTLTKSPDAVRLWLTEPADVPATKLTVASDAGTAIATAAITRDEAKDAPLVAKFTKPLAKGAYTVTWKTMSKDGHVVNGTFGFKVSAP